MTTNHHAFEDSAPPADIPVESIVHNPTPTNNETISFKVNRQTLMVSALAILLVISVFETIELTRLHQALKTWQALPVAAASTTAAPASASGGSALPAQVGGC